MPPCASPSGTDTPSPQPFPPLRRGFLLEVTITTLAYKDGVLVADSQVTSGDRIFSTVKIQSLPDGSLFGGAGGLADILKIRAWAAKGVRGDEPDISEKASFECLHVRPDGSMWLIDDDLTPMEFVGDYIALGTGSPYAMAAMYLGKSPQEAVEVATHFDPASSLPINELRLTKAAPKIRVNVRKKSASNGKK